MDFIAFKSELFDRTIEVLEGMTPDAASGNEILLAAALLRSLKDIQGAAPPWDPADVAAEKWAALYFNAII
jgi:hypothetical protein